MKTYQIKWFGTIYKTVELQATDEDEAMDLFNSGDCKTISYRTIHDDIDEIKETLKKPQFADTVMENLDINLDGQVSITEWMIAQKSTFQKSKPGCATALKAKEKGARVHATETLLPLPRLRRLHSHTRAFCRSCSQPSSTTDRNCC